MYALEETLDDATLVQDDVLFAYRAVTHQRPRMGAYGCRSRNSLHFSNIRNSHLLLARLQGSFPFSRGDSSPLKDGFHAPSRTDAC